MSQAKVDKYKKEKANRKETLKKEKMLNTVRKTVVAVVAVALIGWVGYSAYNAYDSYQPKETAEIDYSALDSLATNLSE